MSRSTQPITVLLARGSESYFLPSQSFHRPAPRTVPPGPWMTRLIVLLAIAAPACFAVALFLALTT